MARTTCRAQMLGMNVFNWGIWIIMTFLVISQFLGIVWSSTNSVLTTTYGNDPSLPPAPIGGFNDEPYGDRAIVCLVQGRVFVPMQLTNVLADKKLAPIVDTSGFSIDAFRVVNRTNVMELQPQVAETYGYVCDRIDNTMHAIQDSCQAMGYNVTRDSLRIVYGVFSNTTYEITKALPILLLPYWDNGIAMSLVIPASDGSACIFRLQGVYQSPAIKYGILRATPRDVRLSKTVDLLKNPGGTWRNGWYEAPDGQHWYSNMITSIDDNSHYGLKVRYFDTIANKELNCTANRDLVGCQNTLMMDRWGKQLSKTTDMDHFDQIFATNGSRFGLFRFESTSTVTVTTVYSLETFISNTSVFIVLFRWFISLGAMLYSRYRGVSDWQTTGVGALSSSRTFNLLPVVLLPRLRLTLTAFFTVGCFFEGQQSAFAEAWYIIYPGIVEVLLYYYSVLNIIAKTTYRRMSDMLFGPTLLMLCLLHYYRQHIVEWDFLHLNSRLSTQILSDEVDTLKLTDFFSSNVAMRINGNAKPIFYAKIVLMALNLLPLLFAEDMTEKRNRRFHTFSVCEIERVLALRASNLGGLGRSEVYARRDSLHSDALISVASTHSFGVPALRIFFASPQGLGAGSRINVRPEKTAVVTPMLNELGPAPKPTDHVLIGYEMSRIGYLVFGGQFLLSFDDWYILTSLAPLRMIEKLWNYRIIVFEVARDKDGTYHVLGSPQLCRLNNPRLRAIPFYQITVCAFQ